MKFAIALTGTDPDEPRGGIGVAMQGYRDALHHQGLPHDVIPSYKAGAFGGGTWFTMVAGSRLLRWVKRQRRRSIVPVVYAHGGGPVGVLRQMLLLVLCRKLGARTLLQVHSAAVLDYLESASWRRTMDAMFRQIDGIAVVAPWWKSVFDQFGVVTPFVVPNCLSYEALERGEDIRRRSFAGNQGAAGDKELILTFMARLVEGKGLRATIEALVQLPAPARLIVAGEGPVRSECEQLAEDLGVASQVEFVGWMSGAEKWDMLARTDIFCVPSVNESFGMGYIEAMCCGIPVLGVEWGPIPDVVLGERCGVLVESQAPALIAAGIEELRSPETRERMSRHAVRWVEDNFSPAAVGRRIESTVETIVGGGPGSDRSR